MDKDGNEIPQSTFSVCKDGLLNIGRGLHKEKRSICESYAYAPVPENTLVSIMSPDGQQTSYEETDSKGCVTFKDIPFSNVSLNFMIHTDNKWHKIPFNITDLVPSLRNVVTHNIYIN